jgi:hypothetical protein
MAHKRQQISIKLVKRFTAGSGGRLEGKFPASISSTEIHATEKRMKRPNYKKTNTAQQKGMLSKENCKLKIERQLEPNSGPGF